MRTLILLALLSVPFIGPSLALADQIAADEVLIMPVVGDVDIETPRGRRMATNVRELIGHGLRAANLRGREVEARCERVACVEEAIAEAEGVSAGVLVRLFQDGSRVAEVVVVVVRSSGRHGSARAPVPRATRSSERSVVAAATSLALATALDDEAYVEELVALRVTGSPEGAAVTIDGMAVGVLPLETQVLRGSRRVGVAMFGYESQVLPIHVSGERELEVTLRALPETGPLADLGHGPSESPGSQSPGSQSPGSQSPGSQSHGSAEGSPWPSYAIGGGMVAAGVALWVAPILTLARRGDLAEVTERSGPFTVDQTAMDGGQIALAIGGSVLLVAGAALLVGRWVRTSPEPSSDAVTSPTFQPSASVSAQGATLNLEGTF